MTETGARDRREGPHLRVPYVRRCSLQFDDGSVESAFIVNINVLGMYVAHGAPRRLGQRVACTFQPPGTERELRAEGVVAWLNPRQQHPVHSLPPGFGVRFEGLETDVREQIEEIVRDYAARHPEAGR